MLLLPKKRVFVVAFNDYRSYTMFFEFIKLGVSILY